MYKSVIEYSNNMNANVIIIAMAPANGLNSKNIAIQTNIIAIIKLKT